MKPHRQPSSLTPAGWNNSVPVEWHDSQWRPHIIQRRIHAARRVLSAWLPGTTAHCSQLNQNHPMNLTRSARRPAAFTLIELLTVIAIIAVLAAMLLPVVSLAITHARITRAKTEEATIVNAIEAYNSTYGRLPVSTNVQVTANAYGSDFTYGVTNLLGGNPVFYNNSEVIAILMNLTTYPNGTATPNYGYVKNPKQIAFLNAQLSGYDPTTGGIGLPGVDKSGIYRDPWGNPYIITVDLNYDGQCQDAVYCKQAVSQTVSGSASGYNGLANPTATPNSDNFLYRGSVMVWSLGPDGKYDASGAVNALNGVNKDNVLSWKQ